MTIDLDPDQTVQTKCYYVLMYLESFTKARFPYEHLYMARTVNLQVPQL